jgi:hypothetical protein
VPVARLTDAQGESLRALWAYLGQRGVGPAGPPFVRYHTFGEAETDVETGVPVAEAVAGEGRIAAGELPRGAAATWHHGSHDGLAGAYARLGSWLEANGRRQVRPRNRSMTRPRRPGRGQGTTDARPGVRLQPQRCRSTPRVLRVPGPVRRPGGRR